MVRRDVTYKITSYNTGKAFLIALLAYVLATLLIIGVFKALDMPKLGVAVWAVSNIIPYLYQKKFKLLFTRNVTLNFQQKFLSISEFGIRDGLLKKECTILWEDIKAYKCYFSASNVTFVTFYMHHGLPKNLSFNDKDQETAIVEESVFSLLYAFITNFNKSQKEEGKICFRPGFFTTKIGIVIILTLLTTVIGLIFFYTLHRPKAVMTTFLPLIITLTLYGKRRKDTKLKVLMENMKKNNTVAKDPSRN